MIELGIIVNTRATEIEVIDQGVVTRRMTFLPAGVELTMALVEYLKTRHSLRIDRLSAQGILLVIGAALPLDENRAMTVRGHGVTDEQPQEVEVTGEEIREAIEEVIEQLVSAAAQRIQHMVSTTQLATPAGSTILLKGEFKHLKNLDRRLAEAIGADVVVDE